MFIPESIPECLKQAVLYLGSARLKINRLFAKMFVTLKFELKALDIKIMFIFGGQQRSCAAMLPTKYEHDSKTNM